MVSKTKRGVFRDTPNLIWSPELGGFKTDVINLTLVSNRLAASRDTQDLTTSVKDAQISLRLDTTLKTPFTLNTSTPYRDKSIYPPINAGDSIGSVEFDDKIKRNTVKKSFIKGIAKDFIITLDHKLHKLIFNNYQRVKNRTIYLPVTLEISYESYSEDLEGVIAIDIKKALTQTGKRFVSDSTEEVSSVTSLVDLNTFSKLAFTQKDTGTKELTMYGKSLAMQKYSLDSKLDQTIAIPYAEVSFGETAEGIYTAASYKTGTIKTKFKKGITSLPLNGSFEYTEHTQTTVRNGFRLKAKNISNITNPELVAYRYVGSGDGSSIEGTTITTTNSPHETLNNYERMYRFTYTAEFNAYLKNLGGSGVLYIGFKGIDFKTGNPVYLATDKMSINIDKGGGLPYVSHIAGASLFDNIAVQGSNLEFDSIRVDVISLHKKRKQLSHSEEITQFTNNGSSVEFSLDINGDMAEAVKRGGQFGLHIGLLSQGKLIKNTESFKLMNEAPIKRNLLAGVTIESGALRHGDNIEVTSPQSVIPSTDGSIDILLFKKGSIPSNPLSIPVQGATTFTHPSIVGYLDVQGTTAKYRKSRYSVEATVNILTKDIQDVDALILLNTSPGVDFKGRYTEYSIIKDLKLSSSTPGSSMGYSDVLNSARTWNTSKAADFTLFTSFDQGGYSANPSTVYISGTTEVIGQAFPDPNMKDTNRSIQSWRLVDEDYTKKYDRRWHGLADVAVETPYPITQETTTQSVMIGREPCIQSVEGIGSRYLKVSGTGFSSNAIVAGSTSGKVSKWVSCINGVSIYNKATKAFVAHVPYTDEVVRHSDGLEFFHIDIAGAYHITNAQELYAVVSTDYGCDWYVMDLPAKTLTYTATITAASVGSTAVIRGTVATVDIVGDVYAAGWLTPISVKQSSVTNIITNNAKAYLHYTDGVYAEAATINQRVYCLLPDFTGITTGAITLSFDTFTQTVAYTYNSATFTTTGNAGHLSIHPGTGKPSSTGWLTGTGLINQKDNTTNITSYSGIDFTFANASGTHRTDIFDSKGAISYKADSYKSIKYAFNNKTGHTNLGSSQGGIAHVQVTDSLTNVSGYTYFYSIDAQSVTVGQEIQKSYFEPIGSYGSPEWGLIPAGKGNDTGCGIPGASNVPWGLFSIDRYKNSSAVTKFNLMGKPKVSIKPYHRSGQVQGYTRLDSPVDTYVRGSSRKSVRKVITGNEVNYLFDKTLGNIDKFQAMETFTPLVFSSNPGIGPSQTTGKVPSGIGLQAKVEFIDAKLLSSKESTEFSNQFTPQLDKLTSLDKFASVKGTYQKGVSTTTDILGNVFNDYKYKGWLYTSSNIASSTWEVVGEITSKESFNECGNKSTSFTLNAYKNLEKGEEYLLETRNTARSNKITITIPETTERGYIKYEGTLLTTKGSGSTPFTTIGSLQNSKVSILSDTKKSPLSSRGELPFLYDIKNGDITVQTELAHTYGYADRLYLRTARNSILTDNVDNYHHTNIGRKHAIRISPSLFNNHRVIEEGAENTLRGVPGNNKDIVNIWLFNPFTGATHLLKNLKITTSGITYTPVRLADSGFAPGDFVRIGVLDKNHNVFISSEEYGLSNIDTANTGHSTIGLRADLNLAEERPVITLGTKFNIGAVHAASILLPYRIKSDFDDPVLINIPLPATFKEINGLWSMYFSPKKSMKDLMLDGLKLKVIYVLTTGRQGATNVGILINNKNVKPLNSTRSSGIPIPPPSLAPSLRHLISQTSDDQILNPRTIDTETIYWSKKLKFDKFYDENTASMEGLLYQQTGHYLGRKFAGKNFLLHPDVIETSSQYTLKNKALSNIQFDIIGNLYLDSTGNILSTTSDVAFLANSKLFSTEVEPFVRYLPTQTATSSIGAFTEWQESHAKLIGVCNWELPDVVYASLEVKQPEYKYPGLKGTDEIKITDRFYIKLVNIDTYNKTALTPSVDTLYKQDYLANDTATTYWDIQPKQIDTTKDTLIRISGKNLLGNLNRKTAYIIPTGYTEPIVRMYNAAGTAYVQGVFYKSEGNDLEYLDASSDSRLYVKFEVPTAGWASTEEWGDLYLETAWSINGVTVTHSATISDACYLTATPKVEIVDSRIQPTSNDNAVYNFKTFNYANLAYNEIVTPSGTEVYTELPNTTLKIGANASNFASTITAKTYWINSTQEQTDKMMTDPTLGSTPVMFHHSAAVMSPTKDWAQWDLPSLSGTALDSSVVKTDTEQSSYAYDLANLRFDWGIEDSSNTLSSVTSTNRGLASYIRNNVTYLHYDMPRIVSVIGSSKEDIINYSGGVVTEGRPSIDIVCEFNGTWDRPKAKNTLGRISALTLTFGDEADSFINIPVGRSQYGQVVVHTYFDIKIVKFYPNSDFVNQVDKLRSGGWIDFNIVVKGRVTDNSIQSFRAFRVAWTPWDTKGTYGGPINSFGSRDAVMYRMRMIEGLDGHLRASWAAHYGATTLETSHQEYLCQKNLTGSINDWWILAGTADKNQIKLYGAREKDLVNNLGNARDKAKLHTYAERETYRGLQLLSTYNIGGDIELGFDTAISDYGSTTEDPVTISDFRFTVGMSTHPGESTDRFSSEFSVGSGAKLGAEYIDADISEVVVLPKDYSTHEDVSNFVINPKQRDWVSKDNAGLVGYDSNLFKNPNFEASSLQYVTAAADHPINNWYTENASTQVLISDTPDGFSDVIGIEDGRQSAMLWHLSGHGGSISQDVILSKSSTFELSFKHKAFDPDLSSLSATYLRPLVSIVGYTYHRTINTATTLAKVYYNFITKQWVAAPVAGETTYTGPSHIGWCTNNIYITNDLDIDVQAFITFTYDDEDQALSLYLGGWLALDNMSLKPSSGEHKVIDNGNFLSYRKVLMNPELKSWDWTLAGGATADPYTVAELANDGVSAMSNRPISGYASLICPAATLSVNEKPSATQTIDKYAIQPNCNYAIRFDAWSALNTAEVAIALKNDTTAEYLQSNGTWGSSVDNPRIILTKAATVTVSEDPLVISQVSSAYEFKFNTNDASIKPDDAYTFNIGNRLQNTDTDKPAVIIDNVSIERIDNDGKDAFKMSGLGDNVMVSGEGGLYLPHDASWDYHNSFSVESIFRLRGTIRNNAVVDSVTGEATAELNTATFDTGLQGDDNPYMELVNLGNGGTSAGSSIFLFNDGSNTKLSGSLGNGVEKLSMTLSANIQTDKWYWAGLSKNAPQNASLDLYEWDGRSDTQSWQVVESSTAFTVATLGTRTYLLENGNFEDGVPGGTTDLIPGWADAGGNGGYTSCTVSTYGTNASQVMFVEAGQNNPDTAQWSFTKIIPYGADIKLEFDIWLVNQASMTQGVSLYFSHGGYSDPDYYEKPFSMGYNSPVGEWVHMTYNFRNTFDPENYPANTKSWLLHFYYQIGTDFFIDNMEMSWTPNSWIPPVADFTGSPRQGEYPHMVTFVNQTIDGVNYEWNFGDGTTSSDEHPTHTYTTADTFDVSLIAQNAHGNHTETKVDYLNITDSPLDANFTNTYPIFVNQDVTFTDTSTGSQAVNSWAWDFGDSTTSTDQNPTHIYTSTGTKTVVLTVTDTDGDTDAYTGYVSVTVEDIITNFKGEPRQDWSPLTVQFTDLSTGGERGTVLWEFGDVAVTTTTSANPLFTYTDEQYYTVTLSVTNELGTTVVETKTDYINDQSLPGPPVADFTIHNLPVNVGDTLGFEDISTEDPTDWLWELGDSSTASSQNTTHSYTVENSYQVKLTATNSIASDSIIKLVQVGTIPVPSMNSTTPNGAAPLVVIFTDTSTQNPTSWSWDFGDGSAAVTTQAATHTYSVNGTYTVKLTATNALGTATTTYPNYIHVGILPTAEFSAAPLHGEPADLITFTDASIDMVGSSLAWSWDFGDGTTLVTGQGPHAHQYAAIGLYTVKLLVSNAYGNDSERKVNYISIGVGDMLSKNYPAQPISIGSKKKEFFHYDRANDFLEKTAVDSKVTDTYYYPNESAKFIWRFNDDVTTKLGGRVNNEVINGTGYLYITQSTSTMFTSDDIWGGMSFRTPLDARNTRTLVAHIPGGQVITTAAVTTAFELITESVNIQSSFACLQGISNESTTADVGAHNIGKHRAFTVASWSKIEPELDHSVGDDNTILSWGDSVAEGNTFLMTTADEALYLTTSWTNIMDLDETLYNNDWGSIVQYAIPDRINTGFGILEDYQKGFSFYNNHYSSGSNSSFMPELCVSLNSTDPSVPDGYVYTPHITTSVGDQSSTLVGDADELPVRSFHTNEMALSTTCVTNLEYVTFLNAYITLFALNAAGTVIETLSTAGSFPILTISSSGTLTNITWDVGTGTYVILNSLHNNLPVTRVSWYGAAYYSNYKNNPSMVGSTDYAYDVSTWNIDMGTTGWLTDGGYMLPSEIFWEQGARGEVVAKLYPNGTDTVTSRLSGSGYASSDVHYDTASVTHVTDYLATTNGLYNMAGNVHEWSHDWYSSTWYNNSTDLFGPATGTTKSLRGGAFDTPAGSEVALRCASRSTALPSAMLDNVGFRLAYRQPCQYQTTYFRFRGLGADSSGAHITQSSNEWWLNLNSFMIDKEDSTIKYYSLRVPESAVRDAGANNTYDSLFDLTEINSVVSQGQYSLKFDIPFSTTASDFALTTTEWQSLVSGIQGTNGTPMTFNRTSIIGCKTDIYSHENTSLTLSVGSETSGWNYYDGKISELAFLPDIFVDENTVQNWVSQSGLKGLDDTRPHGSHFITEIGATRVNGFALKDETATLVEGLAVELSQTNDNFRMDQEGMIGSDNEKHTEL